jgi:inner membrane protein YhjD
MGPGATRPSRRQQRRWLRATTSSAPPTDGGEVTMTATHHHGTPTAGPAGSPAIDEPDAIEGPDEDPGLFGRIGGGIQALIGRVDGFQRAHKATAIPFAVVKKFGDDQAGNLAALVAYYSFFSIFPLLLVFVTVIGFVLQDNKEAQQRLLDSALSQFPVVGDQLRDNIGSVQGSGLALVVGVLLALWGGLGALEAMQNAMNSVWNVPRHKRPSFLVAKLRSLMMLGLLGGLIVATTVVANVRFIPGFLGLPLAMALNAVLFVLAFKVLTEKKDIDWKVMLPGGIVAGVGFTLLQLVGGWYVNRSINGASRVYGTFAVVLGLLTLLYLMSQIVVYAAEINVVLHERLWPRGIVMEDLTDADRRALERYARVEERLPDQVIEVELPEPNGAASTP